MLIIIGEMVVKKMSINPTVDSLLKTRCRGCDLTLADTAVVVTN